MRAPQPIPGFNDFTISADGKVKNVRLGRLRKASVTPKGYKRIVIQQGGKHTQKCFFIHRLVAEAFLPRKEGQNEVNHINGDKFDNRVDNLEWCTRSENERHAAQTGLKGRIFTPNAIRLMRDLSAAGMKQTLIATLFGTRPAYVNTIIHRNRYDWVTD